MDWPERTGITFTEIRLSLSHNLQYQQIINTIFFMGEELKIHDLQNQIQQLRHEITQLNSQLYRQSDQILDLKEVLADDKYMQTKILSTLDGLAKLVETLKKSIEIEEKEVETTLEIVKEG